MKEIDRRGFVLAGAAAAAGAGIGTTALGDHAPYAARAQPQDEAQANADAALSRPSRIACSTYSFWQFGEGVERSVHRCIEYIGDMGFDGVDILERQMESTDNAYVQRLKRMAVERGLDLCGLSTHQGFVSPDPEIRQRNIDTTIRSIELANNLGVPLMRLNTGRWGTIPNFTDFMAARGIEPPLEGYTDEDAYPWVIEAIERCLPAAEKHGVVLALENHWGLGRTAAGVLRIVNAIDSDWLGVLTDTGNFLENIYEQLEMMAPKTTFIQAKTYFGGGNWYTLDLDYERIGSIFRNARFRGYVSLEFEGKDNAMAAVPRSLEVLRHAFGFGA